MLLIFIGSSGSGKSTIANKLPFKKEITTTTREIRFKDGEAQGIDYNYISKEEFNKLKEAGGFIETDQVGDDQYGTPKSILDNIETENKSIILTPLGAVALQEYCKNNNIKIKTILLTLSKEKIEERLISRGDSKKKIEARLKYDNIAEKSKELERQGLLTINKELNTGEMGKEKVEQQVRIFIKKEITKPKKKKIKKNP